MDDGYYTEMDDAILAEYSTNCNVVENNSLIWNPVLTIFKLGLNLNSFLDYKALHSAQ